MAQALDPEREDPGKTERIVAPDITVALPPPGTSTSEQRIAARPRRDDLLDNLRAARRDVRARPAYDGERDAQHEIERLKAELARIAHDRDQAAQERDRTARERDQAVRERDRVANERDQV